MFWLDHYLFHSQMIDSLRKYPEKGWNDMSDGAVSRKDPQMNWTWRSITFLVCYWKDSSNSQEPMNSTKGLNPSDIGFSNMPMCPQHAWSTPNPAYTKLF